MPNFRPRKRKALAEALTEDQIKLLVEGPNPFTDYSTADAVVIEAFGSVEHFRVIFDAYRDELSTLAAPDRPWAWWALEGPGMQAPSFHTVHVGRRIVKRGPSQLKEVPPEMVRSTLLELTK
jgi:hypothetical protein